MSEPNFPIISIDVGRKRVGIAIFGSYGPKADFKTIVGREAKKAEKLILQLLNDKAIKLIVCGLPLDARDQKTEQCVDVENFCQRIKKRSNVPVVFVDEYLSSEEAKAASKTSGPIDDIAAEIIMQRYLQSLEGILKK